MRRKCRHSGAMALVCAGLLVLILSVYILSYAPFVNWELHQREQVESRPGIVAFSPALEFGTGYTCFQPVEWLMARTIAREPLLWWAGKWGVEDDFRSAAFMQP